MMADLIREEKHIVCIMYLNRLGSRKCTFQVLFDRHMKVLLHGYHFRF